MWVFFNQEISAFLESECYNTTQGYMTTFWMLVMKSNDPLKRV